VFIADILGVSCDYSILDADGKMHFERANLLAYAHGEYFAIGESSASLASPRKSSRQAKGRQL
jgi:hypothetical protein